jgi:hypothetical protein
MQKDVFDYIDEDDTQSIPDRTGLLWNFLTVSVLLTAVLIGILFVTVFLNPQVGFNPFPPPTVPVREELPPPTPTPRSVLPATWTPTPTLIPTITNTPPPTSTPLPTQEEPVEEEDDQVVIGDMPIILQEGSLNYIPSIPFHTSEGCDWLGVAGQVLAINDSPVVGLIIEVGGTLGGTNIGDPTILTATGLATAYGLGGYEVKLADEPIDSSGTTWIRVLDQAGLPMSDKIYFYTYNDCQQNLVIINFKQIR